MRPAWKEYLSLPELAPDEQWFERAFCDLSRQRLPGFSGPAPLQITEIEAYLRLCGVTAQQDRIEALTILLALDAEFLDDHRDHDQAQ